MESLIRDKIIEYLVRNESIECSQHGFTIVMSCWSILMHSPNLLMEGTKLMPCIWILLRYLIRSSFWNLKKMESQVMSVLVDLLLVIWTSSGQVVLNGSASDWSGVPQGFVFGPICFYFYLWHWRSSQSCCWFCFAIFADDNEYGRLFELRLMENKCRQNTGKLMERIIKWQMDFNTTNTKCKGDTYGLQ